MLDLGTEVILLSWREGEERGKRQGGFFHWRPKSRYSVPITRVPGFPLHDHCKSTYVCLQLITGSAEGEGGLRKAEQDSAVEAGGVKGQAVCGKAGVCTF